MQLVQKRTTQIVTIETSLAQQAGGRLFTNNVKQLTDAHVDGMSFWRGGVDGTQSKSGSDAGATNTNRCYRDTVPVILDIGYLKPSLVSGLRRQTYSELSGQIQTQTLGLVKDRIS